ncbi:MAG: hypothetical protein IJ336_06070 [Lachnospiraceae bacterium]|nr:hypothetical protein [Lachnospiraceae bacterium]
MNHNSKYSLTDILFILIFFTWFIGSILAMVYFAKNEMGILTIAVFGQYFLVFGIMAMVSGIKNKNFNPIVLVPVIVGIAAIVISFIYQFGSDVVLTFVEEHLPTLFLGAFFIAGIFMLAGAFRSLVVRRLRCKESVVATCVDVWERYTDGGALRYCPVYEAYYNNQKIILCNHIYRKTSDVYVGDIRDICINPENPQEIYEGHTEQGVGLILAVLGTVFILMSSMGIYMYYLG